MNREALYGRTSRTGGIGPGYWRSGMLAAHQEMKAACDRIQARKTPHITRRAIVGDIVARAWNLHYVDLSFADTVTLCLPLLP